MSDPNIWFLTLCVLSNWVPFGMSVLREVSQLQRISVLLKGKLRTDSSWAVEDETGDNTYSLSCFCEPKEAKFTVILSVAVVGFCQKGFWGWR